MSEKNPAPPHPAWSRETIATLLDEHKTPAAAARAAGISRQRFHQLQIAHNVPTRVQDPADPTQWGGSTCVKVTPKQARWAWRTQATRGLRSVSAVVRDALDSLIASGGAEDFAPKRGPRAPLTVYLTPEQHAWLNAHGKGSRSRLIQCALERAMKQGRKL